MLKIASTEISTAFWVYRTSKPLHEATVDDLRLIEKVRKGRKCSYRKWQKVYTPDRVGSSLVTSAQLSCSSNVTKLRWLLECIFEFECSQDCLSSVEQNLKNEKIALYNDVIIMNLDIRPKRESTNQIDFFLIRFSDWLSDKLILANQWSEFLKFCQFDW